MDEKFLHFIWRYQRLNLRGGITTDNQPVSVYQPGQLNFDSGPDFSSAKIRIGDLLWNGSVEIHIDGRDWYHHKHHMDPAYDGVVLHVVWDSKGKETLRSDGTAIPTLQLKDLVDPHDLSKYQQLKVNQSSVPCSGQIKNVNPFTINSMMDKALVTRLQIKAEVVSEHLQKTGNDWEESAYRMLARNFGFKKNAEVFERLSVLLPFKILKKHAANSLQLEALLFGMAGFLDRFISDPYYIELKKEFEFLAKKYQLDVHAIHHHQWKFARLRPANFPALRLAQFSAILAKVPNLFSSIIHESNLTKLILIFSANPSDYWKTHLDFAKPVTKLNNRFGTSSIENIMINTVAPLLTAYSKWYDQPELLDRALAILHQLKPENNHITRIWKDAGIPMKSAFDSQGLLGLYNHYCKDQQCVNCNIGVSLLSK